LWAMEKEIKRYMKKILLGLLYLGGGLKVCYVFINMLVWCVVCTIIETTLFLIFIYLEAFKVGWIRLNTDKASNKGGTLSGCGDVIREKDGNCLCDFS